MLSRFFPLLLLFFFFFFFAISQGCSIGLDYPTLFPACRLVPSQGRYANSNFLSKSAIPEHQHEKYLGKPICFSCYNIVFRKRSNCNSEKDLETRHSRPRLDIEPQIHIPKKKCEGVCNPSVFIFFSFSSFFLSCIFFFQVS